MISKLVEQSRIRKALNDCRSNGFEILEPEDCIKKAISEYGDSLSVSCSFGSCSVVILHMALQIKPDIKVVFENTGVEYPETLSYRDLLVKDWNLNYFETKPKKTFWDCVKNYGFPLYRGGHGKPQCCSYLKEFPFKKFVIEHNIKATITGLRASESRNRMFVIGIYGQSYFTQKYTPIMKINPIAFWTSDQVWSYLHSHNIPINQVYLKGAERSGCMPCTGFKDWEKQLSKTNPKMYRIIQRMKGVELLDNFIALEDKIADTCGQRNIKDLL